MPPRKPASPPPKRRGWPNRSGRGWPPRARRKAQQAKADADAKAAEQARIAAEKAKQVAQDQATAAEQKRAAAEAQARRPRRSPSCHQCRRGQGSVDGREAQGEKQGEKGPNLAALTAGAPQADITKAVQGELRRVGCLSASTDGQWNAASQRSMALFNRHAGTKLDVKLASLDALDAIKLKSSRVCPLVCEHGFKADGNGCSKITCAAGSFLNDDNECEKRRNKPVAKRDSDDRRERPVRERPPSRPEAGLSNPRASAGAAAGGSGQIVCDGRGCMPVKRGCRIQYRGASPMDASGGNVEVCN